jgi:hypothetical protein
MDVKQSKSDKKRRSKLQIELKRVEQELQEQDSESSNELVAAEDEKFDVTAKEKWVKYKSQIQGLNKLLEGSLYKMKTGIEVERSNTQLIELWQEATGRCERLEREIERFRKNEVYKEQLKIVKNELSKMFAENYEVTKDNHDLRMKTSELLVQIETLERKLQLITIQLAEMNDIKSIQIEELKREVQSSKVVIRDLEVENKRNVEMATGLEREIATYKMLIEKLSQNQALLDRKENLAITQRVVTSFTSTQTKEGVVISSGYKTQVTKVNGDDGMSGSGKSGKGTLRVTSSTDTQTEEESEESDN